MVTFWTAARYRPPPPILMESNTMKEFNYQPNGIIKPKPPPGPPPRQFRSGFLGIEIETEESKQAIHDYQQYMLGYMDALKGRQWKQNPMI